MKLRLYNLSPLDIIVESSNYKCENGLLKIETVLQIGKFYSVKDFETDFQTVVLRRSECVKDKRE